MKTINHLFIFTMITFLATLSTVRSQVVINGTDVEPSAILKVVSSNQGILVPRIALSSETDLTTITSPATSLLIYNITSNSSLSPGYYYFNGILWERLFDDLVVYERVAYTNSNTSTNVNANIDLPIFETLEVNEDIQLYKILSTTSLQVIKNGRYEIDLSVHLSSTSNGAEPRLRIEVNGDPVGAMGTSGHISTNAGHQNSSIHLFETFNLASGDIITVQMAQEGAGTTTLASAGSSTIVVTKIQ